MSYVYVAEDSAGQCCKIGMSDDPASRLGALRVANPRLNIVEVYGSFERTVALAIEQTAHSVLSSFAISGEWFQVSPDVAREAIEIAERFHDDASYLRLKTAWDQAPAQDRERFLAQI